LEVNLVSLFDKRARFVTKVKNRWFRVRVIAKHGHQKRVKGRPGFFKLQKKMLFSYFAVGKNKFRHFWPSCKNF